MILSLIEEKQKKKKKKQTKNAKSKKTKQNKKHSPAPYRLESRLIYEEIANWKYYIIVGHTDLGHLVTSWPHGHILVSGIKTNA